MKSCRGSVRQPSYAGPEVDFIVCSRVTDMEVPLVESERTVCIECMELVWVSKISLRLATAPTICVKCAIRIAEEYK